MRRFSTNILGVLLAASIAVTLVLSPQDAHAQDRTLRSRDGLTTVTPFPRSITVYKVYPNRAEYSMLWQVRTVRRDGTVKNEERLRVNVIGCTEEQGSVWSEGNEDHTYWTGEGQQLFDGVAIATCVIGMRARAELQNASL